MMSLEPRSQPVHDFYKYGDAITAYNTKAEALDTLKIPATLTDNCYLTEPIKFLIAKSVNCLKSVNELCSSNSNFMLQLLNSQLFQRPSRLSEARDPTDVFDINIQACRHTFTNCTKCATVEDVEALGEEVFDEIQMEFLINDTSIASLTVTFFSHDELVCGIDELGSAKVIQKISVNFTNLNDKREKTHGMRSRGYHDNELIVASRLRPLNESAPEGEMVFDYFQSDSDFYMKTPESRKGKCVLNANFYDTIRFNEHSQTLCTAELLRDEKLNETTCQQYQRQIIHFLFNTMNLTANITQEASDVFISQFWMPRNDSSAWVRVDMKPLGSPETKETDKTLTCANLATSVKYSFYSSRARVMTTRKYENVIDRVAVEFGKVEELKFPVDDGNQTVKVLLEISVQFFDAANYAAKNLIG